MVVPSSTGFTMIVISSGTLRVSGVEDGMRGDSVRLLSIMGGSVEVLSEEGEVRGREHSEEGFDVR